MLCEDRDAACDAEEFTAREDAGGGMTDVGDEGVVSRIWGGEEESR